jgi:hypothetical protein
MNLFDLFSGMQYPRWMMVFGCVVLLIGFVGFAVTKNKNIDTRPPAPSAKDPKGSGV